VESSQKQFKYYAFISYRHADNKEEGRHWASWLHQALETYEIPESLVGTYNLRGEVIPQRIFPIFRDEEELPTDANLGSAITRALDTTNFLIVLCSPRAVESTYVAGEIDYFKRLGRSDSVMAAIIEGEPNASLDQGKQSSGYKAEDECFPRPMQFLYRNGNQTNERAEAIAADFRIVYDHKSQQGWTSAAYYKDFLETNTRLSKTQINSKVKQYDDQLKLMLLKVVAGIIGVALGDLTKRDHAYQLKLEKQKAKRLRNWLSGMASLAIVAMFAGVVAYFQKVEADHQRLIAINNEALAKGNEQRAIQQRNQALISQSRFLSEKSSEFRRSGDSNIGLLLSLNALPGIYGGTRPLLDLAKESLALSANNQTKKLVLQNNGALNAIFVKGGEQIFTLKGESSAFWDAETGEELKNIKLASETNVVLFSPDEKQLLTTESFNSAIKIWDTNTGKLIK
jgi:hypothetical protein